MLVVIRAQRRRDDVREAAQDAIFVEARDLLQLFGELLLQAGKV